ncbi:NADH dehydrogenase [Candidatus Tenderia electrophaga]|jgi:NADH-quinone oxidoreductase subunit C|uniref:NADH-quinone oxidoreductase subunit C n=1 Tax=Candidatus Tenderia electrophaga TaxID=1748243 RepID=A0A0S2TCA3_9GAMM|nr:NADH dehydrogenase [Candidatus Tenderia electrophaga]
MSTSNEKLVERLENRFGDSIKNCRVAADEVTIEINRNELLEVCAALRDDAGLHFELLIDLCGVDYSEYGEGAWQGLRFAVVYHLLSIKNNCRLRLRVFTDDDEPRVDSVVGIWSGANWFERECFDLFGILFDGHPDLRRLLTDYGFIGHPFRKDFPLLGHVEMRYDPERRRVVYEPVETEMRMIVPRVIRDDNRYEADSKGIPDRG